MTLLDICELVLILKEALAARFTHGYRHIWHHILEEPSGLIGAILRVVNDEHFFISHVLKDTFIHFHGFLAFGVHLVLELLKHSLGKQVVFDVILLIIESESLFITMHPVLLPPVIMSGLTLLHAREL